MRHCLILLLFPIIAHSQDAKPSAEQLSFFEKKIRPVLVEKCYGCHSEKAASIKGGLQLDTRMGIRLGGDTGPAVVPKDLKKSRLILAIQSSDPEFSMPPKQAGGRLPDSVIKDLETWIADGAADPRDGAVKPIPKATDSKRDWWAFQPVQPPKIPTVTDANWSKNEIDRFILAKLEANKLKPVGDASASQLLRRLSQDLTGLPPTAEEARQFTIDWNTTADREGLWAKMVNAYLKSPAFGEHWGRHWLDVARFAESSGKDVNVLFPQAWRYRDYVIDQFNRDVPYNEFVREQIAGDLLPSSSDADRSRKLIATGFLALGPKSLNEINPKQFAVELADEQIDTFSQAFMGLTISCARCHDHKFDPISHNEYTALAGIFLSSDTKYGTPGGVQGRNQSTLRELPAKTGIVISKPMPSSERKAKQDRLDKLSVQVREALAARAGGKTATDGLTNFDVVRLITQSSQLQAELASFELDGTPKLMAMAMAEKPTTIPKKGPASGVTPKGGRRPTSGFEVIGDSPKFGRGDIANVGDPVPRSMIGLFPNIKSPAIPKSSSGRLELANWLTDPKHPLTARVFVNRTWGWLFGRGIVASVDHFGMTGELPSHPELLDYLATSFVQQKWSVKTLIRQIVTSHAYRLANSDNQVAFTKDPENALLWRHSSRRLQAEQLRDGMLFASQSISPTLPQGSMIGRSGDGPIGGDRFMAITEDKVAKADGDHRSVYLPIARNVQPESLAVFDLPDAASVQGQRQVTNVPSQALYMLNSEFVAKQAQRIAERLLKQFPGNSEQQVTERYTHLSWLIFSRPPETAEISAAQKLLKSSDSSASASWTRIVRAMFASAEFRYID